MPDVDKVVNSFNNRDFDSERAALLARQQELRAQADALDLDKAANSTLEAIGKNADASLRAAESAAAQTRVRLSEQQERFKLGVIADGRSLDDEIPEQESLQEEKLSRGSVGPGPSGNKYAALMNKKRSQQDQERAS